MNVNFKSNLRVKMTKIYFFKDKVRKKNLVKR